jgi:uncharacterized protein
MAEVLEIELAMREGADVRIQVCRLPAGSRVNDALRTCGVAMVPGRVGIFGRVVQGDEPLRAGDRVEIYEPLRQDPKAARRERVRRARRG